jgi:hypothetical protein
MRTADVKTLRHGPITDDNLQVRSTHGVDAMVGKALLL